MSWMENLKVEHYYKNEIVIEKPVRIGVNTISQTINSNANRNLRTPPQIPKNNVSPWTQNQDLKNPECK
jgi:hypothetical protein